MRRFPLNISDSILGNIKYRNNVVTGEIAVDNGNNTYDVYITGSASAYPNIPTTLREPNFSVGEAVEILVEYGNKEMPIIIGRSKKVAQEFKEIEVSYSGGTSVSTLDAYSITINSAYLEGRISIEGMENCTERGFHYGTSTGYELPDVSSTGSFAAGSYNEQVTGLSDNTTYHFQAYVLDVNNDEQTGDDKIFTTTTTIVSVSKIFVYGYHTVDGYCIKSYDIDGNYINTFSVGEIYEYAQWNSMCVDGDDNIYYMDKDATNYYIYKYDKDGNQLLKKTVQVVGQGSIISICIGNDGYIYSLEISLPWGGSKRFIVKRSSSDLSLIDKLDKGVELHKGITCDSNGYLYIVNTSDDEIEKWTMGGKIASHSVNLAYGFSLAWAGSLVGLTRAGDILTFPLALDEDQTAWNLEYNYHYTISSLENDFIAGGRDRILRYEIDKTKVWETTITDDEIYAVAAYPF